MGGAIALSRGAPDALAPKLQAATAMMPARDPSPPSKHASQPGQCANGHDRHSGDIQG